MKCNYRLYGGLVLLSLVITGAFLLMMPDTVPMHYNTAGVADRFGSKYENLLFPAAIAVIAILFFTLSKTKHIQPLNEKVFFFTGLSVLIFFNILFTYFLWTALTYQEDGAVMPEFGGVVDLAAGTLMVVLGNIMPKARRNSLFGLRTKWSMSSDRVWQKSQRFAGIASVIEGLLLILLSGASADWRQPLTVILICAWLLICTAASLIYYRQEQHAGG